MTLGASKKIKFNVMFKGDQFNNNRGKGLGQEKFKLLIKIKPKQFVAATASLFLAKGPVP